MSKVLNLILEYLVKGLPNLSIPVIKEIFFLLKILQFLINNLISDVNEDIDLVLEAIIFFLHIYIKVI